ncbi:MAG: RNA-binding protein [Nitrospirota bacterium]|nr:RNA-binding protein [Nitrospirota bacterium]
MRIYVGGFSSVLSTDQLRTLFSLHGRVTSAQVLMNKHTGQSRGFGFIEMGSTEETHSAIAALNGANLDGHTLRCFAV